MKDKEKAKALLDEAVSAYRDLPETPETLSGTARSLILRAAADGAAAPRTAPGLFPPVRRMALAGGFPLALAASLLVWVAVQQRGTDIAPGPSAIRAAKVGDRVVFSIENGGREHVIRKSDRADRFDSEAAGKVTGGAFEDRLDSGPDLVFYRID